MLKLDLMDFIRGFCLILIAFLITTMIVRDVRYHEQKSEVCHQGKKYAVVEHRDKSYLLDLGEECDSIEKPIK